MLVIEVPDSALIPTLSLDHVTVGSEKVEATHENVTAAPKTALCEEGEVVIPEKIVSDERMGDGWWIELDLGYHEFKCNSF